MFARVSRAGQRHAPDCIYIDICKLCHRPGDCLLVDKLPPPPPASRTCLRHCLRLPLYTDVYELQDHLVATLNVLRTERWHTKSNLRVTLYMRISENRRPVSYHQVSLGSRNSRHRESRTPPEKSGISGGHLDTYPAIKYDLLF